MMCYFFTMSEHYHHGNLRQALLAEGLKMLNREGVAAFSLRKLAQRLRVSHSAPYRHFKDKEDLLRGIVEESTSKFRSALEASVGEPGNSGEERKKDPKDKLVQLGLGYVKFYLENPEVLTLFSLLTDEKAFLQGKLSRGGKAPLPGGAGCGSSSLDELSSDEGFELFRRIAREAAPFHPELSEREILLGYWSKVHGLAAILVSMKNFIPPGELESMLERVLRTPF